MKFEDGQIIEHDGCYTFYVLPLARAARDSAWDFPSFVMWLGLDELWEVIVTPCIPPGRMPLSSQVP